MALVSMEKATGPLEEAELQDQEQKWGFRLPDGYREFLLKYDGGRPEPFSFRFKGSENGSTVHSFLGIKQDRYRDLQKKLKDYEGRLPKRFFPIAYDEGGNQICIAIAGDDRGKVYFWDHELEADASQGEDPEIADNIVLIADSFSEFLDGLYDE